MSKGPSVKKRWQNLIHRKCVCCDYRLDHKRVPNENKPGFMIDIWECSGGCGFVISRKSYVNILTDEKHIMRLFLSPHEREILWVALGEIRQEEVGVA